MKVLAIATILSSFSQGTISQRQLCLPNCRDIATTPHLCPLLTNRCQESMMKIFCARSCNVCTPCPTEQTTSSSTDIARGVTGELQTCEIDTCVDKASHNRCVVIRNVIPNGCSIYPLSCRKMCKQCRPCAVPDPVKPCSTNCKDLDHSCVHWKSLGYCNRSSEYYQFTSEECPLSCGGCTKCPTPEPQNTALPPTPLACNTTCSDNKPNETCTIWKQEGYCNQTKRYPAILEACALTCGACKLCPTEIPPTSSCNEDCHDTNEECTYWKIEGYCDESNGYPRVREVCPKSCGICRACPIADNLTALPPTREEFESVQNSTSKV